MAVVTSNSSRYCIDGLDQSTLLALHVLELDARGQGQRVARRLLLRVERRRASEDRHDVARDQGVDVRRVRLDDPLAAADELGAHPLGHAAVDVGIDVWLVNCGTPIVLM